MKSLVVKTSAKMEKLEAALAEFNKVSPVTAFVNRKFKFRNFGYQEVMFPKVSGKVEKKTFQTFMRHLASFKIWVECMNVTVTSSYGQEWAKNNIGARYNGVDVDVPYSDIVVGEKVVHGKTVPKIIRLYDTKMSAVKRELNLLVDGADRLGALNHRKHRMRYDKIRWFTDGVMEENMIIETDDDGNVVSETPTGEFSPVFDFEKQGHSEQYSNFKHYRRKYFQIVWKKWDDEMFGDPVPKKAMKEKVVPNQTESKEDISTLTGQALFEALNPHLK